MKRITMGVMSMVVAVGVAMAGGDTAKDAKAAGATPPASKQVKSPVSKVDCSGCPQVDCGDCPKCVECGKCADCPEVKPPKRVEVIRYVDVPVKPRSEWFAAGSALYLGGAGVGGGVGYKFRNGIMVVGQAAYLTRHGGADDVALRYRTIETHQQEDAWGGVATVLIPLGRRK